MKKSNIAKRINPVIIMQNCSIGKNVYIGPGSVIEQNVTVGDNVKIGNNCIIQTGVVIPPGTVIEDDVFIGAYTKLVSNALQTIIIKKSTYISSPVISTSEIIK